MGKTKKDTNARVAGRRKEIKERTAEQLCMDNISTSLNESNDSSILDSSESTSLLFAVLTLETDNRLGGKRGTGVPGYGVRGPGVRGPGVWKMRGLVENAGSSGKHGV